MLDCKYIANQKSTAQWKTCLKKRATVLATADLMKSYILARAQFIV
jgi:hypothetical protein